MKRALVISLILFLGFSVANLVFAIARHVPHTAPLATRWSSPLKLPLAPRSWPGPTPHPQPWPVVDYRTEAREFGRVRIDARATSSPDGQFAMAIDRSGWPLPVLQHTERWWPWTHPTWSMTPNRQDAGFSLLLPGLALNPLLATGVVWACILAPVLAARAIARRRRRRAGHCRKCGYDLRGLGPDSPCPECGTALPTGAAPA